MAARSGDELVGYASMLIIHSLCDKNHLQGIVQDIYLSPQFRKGMNGINFVKEIEKQLFNLGVNSVTIAERGESTGKLYKRLGYKANERLWVKGV